MLLIFPEASLPPGGLFVEDKQSRYATDFDDLKIGKITEGKSLPCKIHRDTLCGAMNFDRGWQWRGSKLPLCINIRS